MQKRTGRQTDGAGFIGPAGRQGGSKKCPFGPNLPKIGPNELHLEILKMQLISVCSRLLNGKLVLVLIHLAQVFQPEYFDCKLQSYLEKSW